MAVSQKYLQKYNFLEIQSFYDKGFSRKEVCTKFDISIDGLNLASKIGLFFARKTHSDLTKQKISEVRKKYILNNPDKAPYKLNHSSKESYPERYFSELFKKEEVKVTRYFQIGLYELDFCIPEKKIDIEIDGNQHYYDSKIIESDIRRTKFLEENGWHVIRINWSKYNSLSFEDKLEYISNLKKYINNLINEKPTIITYNNICKCGLPKLNKSKHCKKCSYIKQRKVERPSYQELIYEVTSNGVSSTSRKYGVSFPTIKKWIKKYES